MAKAKAVTTSAVNTGAGLQKTKCPLSLVDFIQSANPLAISIDGQILAASVKQFSTGSFGWFANGSVTILVGGVPVKVQCGINLTVANSKEADRE